METCKSNYKEIHKNIKVLVLIMILALSFSGCNNTKGTRIKSGEQLTFFIASDTHYLAKSLTDGGKAFQDFIKSSDGRELNYLDEIMRAFSNDIKKKKPQVLIISGDLTTNGEKESHLELAKLMKGIERDGTSVYVIPGNHDILNPNARSFKGESQYTTDYINSKDFVKIYKEFGYSEAISRDKNSLSYLAAPSEDLWLLMLDTAQYENNLKLGYPQMDGRIAEGTLQWIKECSELAKSKGAKIVAVTHHNLLDHSETIREGYTLNNSKEVLNLFQQCDIHLNISGHTHVQDIKSNTTESFSVYDIVTASTGIYPQKYGILKYSSTSGFDYSTDSVDVESWARENGISDNNLTNFKEYSRKSIEERLSSRIISRLAITDFYSEQELNEMVEVYNALNLRNYEGKKEVGTSEIKGMPGFKLWLRSEAAASRKNVLKLAETDGEENNKLHIPVSKLQN